jgi:YgiT-type zinc finger domain-containing protein
MKCVVCKTGEAHDGHTTVTLERNNTVIIVKGVPAAVCNNCWEYRLAENIAERVFAQAGDAVQGKAELSIVNYVG